MELTPQQQSVLEQLELLIRQGSDIGSAVSKLQLMGISSEILDVVVSVRQRVIEERFTISMGRSISAEDDASPPWYSGPAAGDIFWPRLRITLENDPAWADAVPTIDESSTDVVGLLAPFSARRGHMVSVLG